MDRHRVGEAKRADAAQFWRHRHSRHQTRCLDPRLSRGDKVLLEKALAMLVWKTKLFKGYLPTHRTYLEIAHKHPKEKGTREYDDSMAP